MNNCLWILSPLVVNVSSKHEPQVALLKNRLNYVKTEPKSETSTTRRFTFFTILLHDFVKLPYMVAIDLSTARPPVLVFMIYASLA